MQIYRYLFFVIILSACTIREGAFYKENFRSRKLLVNASCGILDSASIRRMDYSELWYEDGSGFRQGEEQKFFWGIKSNQSCINYINNSLNNNGIDFLLTPDNFFEADNLNEKIKQFKMQGCDALLNIYIGRGLLIENIIERNSPFTTITKQKEIPLVMLSINMQDLNTYDKIWSMKKQFKTNNIDSLLTSIILKLKNWQVIK